MMPWVLRQRVLEREARVLRVLREQSTRVEPVGACQQLQGAADVIQPRARIGKAVQTDVAEIEQDPTAVGAEFRGWTLLE